MSDTGKRNGPPEDEEALRPGPPSEDPQEREIARLLRLAGPRAAADPERGERVKAAVHASWRAELRARRVRVALRWMALPAAAAVVVIAVVGLVRLLPRRTAGEAPAPLAVLERAQGPLHRADGGSVSAGAPLAAGTEISTGPGGRGSMRHLSGASLRLDSDTTFRLVSESVVDLERGAVYVDSQGAGRASLGVRTPAGIVRDVGTQFEVRLAEQGLLVTVREGLASLDQGEGGLEISAGTRLTAGPGGEISRREVSPFGPEWDWILQIAPPLSLEGQTLGSFLAWVSRETGRPFRFADPATARERASIVLHGSLSGLRPDEAPAAILPTCGLTSRLEGEVLVIDSLDPEKKSP